jgi:hypothetical protein
MLSAGNSTFLSYSFACNKQDFTPQNNAPFLTYTASHDLGRHITPNLDFPSLSPSLPAPNNC